MEEKGGLTISEVMQKSDEGIQSFRVESIVENPSQFGGAADPPAADAPATSVTAASMNVKKKRGRPKKFAPDGSVMALSPMPISASVPLTGDYSGWKQGSGKRGYSLKKKFNLEFGSLGETMAYSVGGNFTPHVMIVNAGEDVNMKILSFSQQGSRAICILAANGSISNVTLGQPNSSGGTLTYEGHFEILSLTGSFILNDDGLTKSRTGGMSVSLAGPDGQVLGGGLAGMLVAAGSVQVVIGSFLPGHTLEQTPKKAKYEHTIAFAPIAANPISEERYDAAFNGSNQNPSTTIFFQGDDDLALNSIPGSKITDIDNNLSLTGEYYGERNHDITY